MLFFECIEEYQNNKVDRISFIGHFILLVVSVLSNITIMFLKLSDYYLDLIDLITNIVIGCVF